jgi:hypothetical protein
MSTPLCAESLTYGSALYVVHALASLSIGAIFHNIELGAALGSRLCGQNYACAIRLAKRRQPYRLCRGADLEPDERMATLAMGRLAVEVTKLSSQPPLT